MAEEGITDAQLVLLRAEEGANLAQENNALFAKFEAGAGLNSVKSIWNKFVANGNTQLELQERKALALSLWEINKTSKDMVLQSTDRQKILAPINTTMLASLSEVAQCNRSRADLKDAGCEGRILAVCQLMIIQREEKEKNEAKKETQEALESITRLHTNQADAGEKVPKKVIDIGKRMEELGLKGLPRQFWPTQAQVNSMRHSLEKGFRFPFFDLKAKPWQPRSNRWLVQTGLTQAEMTNTMREAAVSAGLNPAVTEKQITAEVAEKAKKTNLPVTHWLFLYKTAMVSWLVAQDIEVGIEFMQFYLMNNTA